jgi:hypothetical protein
MSRSPRAARHSAGVIFEVNAIYFFTINGILDHCRDSVPRLDNVPCSSKVNEQPMPASRRARKPPRRARKAKRRAGSNLISLLLDIEQPLQDATHTVEALRLVGHGLSSHDHVGGDAVAELARIAGGRLQVVEDTWKKVLEARRRGKS